MMRRILGAPLGGTTVGGQYGLESLASILMVPPNGAGGGGRYLPSIVVVASGEPGRGLLSMSRWDGDHYCDCACPQKPKPAFSDTEHLTFFPTFLRFDPERTPGE